MDPGKGFVHRLCLHRAYNDMKECLISLLYPLDNRHSDPGWYLNNTEVCLLGTRMFPHQTGGLFAQQGLQHFGLPGVSPSADNKAILLLLYSVFTYFQTEYIPIVQATGKVKRPSIPRATVF